MVTGDPFEEEPMIAALNLADKRDWTVDDVARLPEDLPYELIDGRLALTPAPLPIHQSLGIEIVLALRANWPAGYYLATDQSVLVDHRNEPRPDVVLMRREGANRTPVLAADVILVAEVVSPSSRVSDREDKMKLYSYAGIPAYWIIDPLGDRITFSQFLLSSGGTYHCQLQAEGLVTIDQPWKVTLDLAAWTQERDELREDARPDI
ncbi:hypothetical protein AFR_36365 [Actinoplanes friuliensis DSM 7358]|jgi:Uma2 family endonuclease|uniref:Putative restriction endonuclease domain-containing protein n=2 Tax=Actinoplanes friuliensis TaxID=196914 RepID=U5W8Q5_9ACTN|nr:hypothetical protein AFR_36365 [Actinoplanes friuliensis DSM 7358]